MNVTRYDYDARHRLTKVTLPPMAEDPQNPSTHEYAYDDANQLVQETDALGRFRGHEPILTHWERFSRFPACLD